MRDTGHLFVVHGRLESIGCDATIVPTDGAFHLERYWGPLLGTTDVGALRPPGWGPGGVARSAGGEAIWFLDVATQDIATLVRQARRALHAVADEGLRPGDGRALPLVALPVLGSGGGGFAHVKGDLLTALLEMMTTEAAERGIDVAFVASDPSAFAALQAVRRRRPFDGLDEARLAQARKLGARAAGGDLALFLGAGVSVAAGLPSWGQLLTRLTPDGVAVDGLGPLDHAELLRKLATSPALSTGGPTLGERVVEALGEERKPSLSHALLAGLGCREVVTTNYDDLYEQAVAAVAGRPAERFGEVIAVLPWVRPRPDLPWILKMHGDTRRPASIVLARRDFVRYDATWRPVGAVVQSLMLSRHLLVVGASLTDDNLLRLAHEVMAFRSANVTAPEPIGTVLTLEGKAAAARLWEGELDHVAVSDASIGTDSGTAPDAGRAVAVRALAIFLDAVGMHAATDTSYLVDARYVGMLDGEAAEAAADLARRLHDAAVTLGRGSSDSPWTALAAGLRRFGA